MSRCPARARSSNSQQTHSHVLYCIETQERVLREELAAAKASEKSARAEARRAHFIGFLFLVFENISSVYPVYTLLIHPVVTWWSTPPDTSGSWGISNRRLLRQNGLVRTAVPFWGQTAQTPSNFYPNCPQHGTAVLKGFINPGSLEHHHE